MSYVNSIKRFVGQYKGIAIPVTAGLLVAGAVVAWVGPPGSPPTCTSGATGCGVPILADSSGNVSVTGKIGIGAANTASWQEKITAASGNSGLYVSSSASGVQAAAGSGYGGYFTGGSGVYGGASSGYGVYGASSNSYGVLGVNSGNNTSGGYFSGGNGLYAVDSSYYGAYIGYSYYSLYGNGYIYGGLGDVSPSDARLKTNIVDLPATDGLAAILKLRPVTFNWKDAKDDKVTGQQIGFIAQEVQPILPGVVTTNPDTTITLADGTTQTITDTLGLDYQKLVVPLVLAVQQLNVKVNAQQQEIDQLKAQVAALQNK